ncbi:MAG: pyridoxal kinase [Cohaesibacter sp.]|nr:pyridoxal kinase [Cohaesibacter sp.]
MSQARQPAKNQKPIILVISSHVYAGCVGNRAAAFALERMGYQVWEIPTILLPWHPGHGPSTRTIPDDKNFAQSLQELTTHADFPNVAAVLSGYLGQTSQAKAIADLVTALKKANPNTLYLCDPVMGEEKGLYIHQDTASAIRDALLPLSDIATPNRFEFAWLTQSKPERNEDMIEASQTWPVPQTIITSAFPMLRNAIGNLLISKTDPSNDATQAILCEHQALANPPSGTGDLFSALFLGHFLATQNEEHSLKLASSGVFEIVARTLAIESKDLQLVAFQDRFMAPMAMVNLRKIGSKPKLSAFRKGPKRAKKHE